MVHYRWHYPASAKFAAQRMANGNPEVVKRMLDWGPRACRATGTDSAQQRDAAEAEYLRILQAAETQLFDAPTDFALHVLGEMASTYSPYVLANRDAQHVGAKAFHVEIYGEDASYLSRPYPEASRNRVIKRIKKLDSKQSRKVQAMLSNIGLSGTFD